MILCFMLFKSLMKIKIEIESRLHYIVIIAYHRMTLGWKDGGIRKSEFVAKTQFLYPTSSPSEHEVEMFLGISLIIKSKIPL